MKFNSHVNSLRYSGHILYTFTLSFASLASFLLVSSEACAQKHNQSAIVLEQDSLLLGPITVVVSALALKITAKRSGLVIVSKSPDWRVSGFNSRTKKIFTTSFKEYSAARANGTQSIFTAFHGFTLSDVPLEKCGPATFFNYAVQNFKASESFQRRMEQRRKTEKINGSTPENVNYQILNLPVYSAPECNILARTTGCAELSRIPLTLIYTGTDKKPHNWLVTTSIKKTQVTDKEFAIPNDYTAVKSEPMVNQTEATAEGVMDLFETGQHRLRDKLFIKE